MVKISEDPSHLWLPSQGSVDLRVKASSVSAHAKKKLRIVQQFDAVIRVGLDKREQDTLATTQSGQQKDVRTTTQTVAEDTGRHQQVLKTVAFPITVRDIWAKPCPSSKLNPTKFTVEPDVRT